MAASDYDVLAFGSDGLPCDRTAEFSGVAAEIYKDYLCLTSGQAHLQIRHGDLEFCHVSVKAARHEAQRAIFVYCEEVVFPDNGGAATVRRFAGVGCGDCYKSIAECLRESRPEEFAKLGLTEEEVQECSVWSSSEKQWGLAVIRNNEYEDFDLSHLPRPGLGDCWVGVRPETAEAFFSWLYGVLELDGDYSHLEEPRRWYETVRTNSNHE